MFFFGHYSQWYKYSHGRTYCLYICTAGNHKVMSRIEQFKFDGGNVNPRHAGLCEFNTNEKQRKEGPFMAFDIAASFKMPDDGLPTSCQFTLLCVRDADGTMHEVELDLSKPHACLSATIGGGIVYDPNQDPSKAAKAKSNNSVDLTDSPPTSRITPLILQTVLLPSRITPLILQTVLLPSRITPLILQTVLLQLPRPSRITKPLILRMIVLLLTRQVGVISWGKMEGGTLLMCVAWPLARRHTTHYLIVMSTSSAPTTHIGKLYLSNIIS